MKRSNALIGLVVAVLVSFIACTDSMQDAFYWEDFETVCDGVPCGWERVRGEPDQAVWVETIHPGEHGLRLTGEVAVRGSFAAPSDAPASANGLVMSVAARCDLGSAIEIDVVFQDEFGGVYVAHAYPFTDTAWTDGGTTFLSFDDAPPTGFVTNVTGIALNKIGSGTCEVTHLAIEQDVVASGC